MDLEARRAATLEAGLRVGRLMTELTEDEVDVFTHVSDQRESDEM